MFVALLYDVPGDRTQIFLKLGRRFISHQQNSVLWGEMKESVFLEFKKELQNNIDKNDNITLLVAKNSNNVDVITLQNNAHSSGPGKELNERGIGGKVVVL